MLGGVAVLIARLGMRREVALYCELNAPLMSRRHIRLVLHIRLHARPRAGLAVRFVSAGPRSHLEKI